MGTGHSAGATRTPGGGSRITHPPQQLTQFPRAVTLQLSTGTRGNTRLLFLQQPPKNGAVLQLLQPTSVLFRLKALGSAPARDNLPSRTSTGTCGMRKVPCRPLPSQAWSLEGPAPPPPLPGSTCLSLLLGAFPDSMSPGIPFCISGLFPHQSQVTVDHVYGTSTCQLWPPGPCMCWQSLVCVGQGYAGDRAGKSLLFPQHVSGQQEGSLTRTHPGS